jgi:phage minor structural protein
MIPILYQSVTEGTVPNDYGIGALTDCLSCVVKEDRNGSYELALTYAVSGIHAEEIKPNRIIKAKPNFNDNPQLFRIYKVGKNMNGRFEVNAQHISYDLSGKILPANIVTFDSLATVQALTNQGGGNFTITTDISSTRTFKSFTPASTRSWFGGKEGSLLDIYGGEWKYDNFTCSLLASRGTNRGATIRNGKNLTELSQEISIENLVTAVLPYAINPDNQAIVTGTKKSTGLSIGVDREIAVDFTEKVDWKDSTPVSTQLTNIVNNYVSSNLSALINMKDSITLNFVQLSDLKERVDLCDTVQIYYEALGITATAKCVSATWDVLADRYSSSTFGDTVTTISDTISTVQKKVELVPTKTEVAESIDRQTELITGNLGGYVVFHDSDSDGQPDEILIMNTADIATATNVWRWNKNGLGYSGTGYAGPYNTLALTSDGKINASAITAGILTADLIKAGILSDSQGNSTINMTNGVARLLNLKALSSFDLIEADDTIYASMGHSRPTEAHLNLLTYAKLTGSNTNSRLTINCADVNSQGKSQVMLDATDGQASLTLGRGAGSSTFTNCAFMYSANDGGHLYLRDGSGNNRVQLENSTNGGQLYLKNTSGVNQVSTYINSDGGQLLLGNGSRSQIILQNSSYGGHLFIKNDSDNVVAQFNTGSTNKDGLMYLFKADHTTTIYAIGNTGNITCVSLTQTSSRKVKDNIKPIEDSAKVLELQAVSFDFKDKDLGTDKRGFVAEEVAEILPNLVSPEEDGKPMSLDYIGLIAYLQDVIKKHEERIKVLEEKITKLGG